MLDDGLAQITFRYEQFAKGVTEDLYREIKDDAGLYYRTKMKEDFGKFRTPSLRYTLYTAPYMHNGAFFDLFEVVEFYNKGGNPEDPLLDKKMKPLNLTDAEVGFLVDFLEALTDT